MRVDVAQNWNNHYIFMENKGNNNISEGSSKVSSEIGDGVVKNENCDKKVDEKTDADTKNEGNEAVKTEVKGTKNGPALDKGAKVEEVLSKCLEKKIEIEKNNIIENQASNTVKNAKTQFGNGKSIEVNENSNDMKEIVFIQKPKRTKSRKSLKKMPSINNIDVDVNGNRSIHRTDR